MRALRHGMAGAAGLEIWGPYEDKAYHPVGDPCRPVSTRVPICAASERAPIRTNYAGFGLDPRFAAAGDSIPATALMSDFTVSGWASIPRGRRLHRRQLGLRQPIEDYYTTAVRTGLRLLIIGWEKERLSSARTRSFAMKDKGRHRKKVTFEWNDGGSDEGHSLLVQAGAKRTTSGSTCRQPNYALVELRQVMMGERRVGPVNVQRAIPSTNAACCRWASWMPRWNEGDVLTLIWGEPDGGTDKTSTERHKQAEIRVRVAPTPYASDARENYADSWRYPQELSPKTPSRARRHRPGTRARPHEARGRTPCLVVLFELHGVRHRIRAWTPIPTCVISGC